MNFFFRLLIFYYSFVSFLQRKVFVKNIKKNDLVLDVGSGDKPFWRADVVVDKYLEDDQQRHSGSMLFDKRKLFIRADVEELPFRDKVFDFVFCTHLLEHVENPDKAIRELMRVAKRGYIEVPNAILDLFEPFPPHLWFCDYSDGVLIFIQKEKEKFFFIRSTEDFGKKFFRNAQFQYLLAKHQDNIFIRLRWEKLISFKVIRSKDPYIYKYEEGIGQKKDVSTKLGFIFYKLFYFLLSFLLYKEKKLIKENLLKK